jgi:hypothetical protein
MLVDTPFYHNSLRNTTIAFGNLFNEIYIDTEGKRIKVPLQYLSKEKFVTRNIYRAEVDGDDPKVENTLPAMGFEIGNVQYDPSRHTNKMNFVQTGVNKMYNRVPYNVEFTLYVGTRKIDDSFRIVEHIVPFFSPEFIISVIDVDPTKPVTIPITLDSTDMEVIVDEGFEDRRSVLWTLSFTAKIYLYPDIKNSTIIEKMIVNLYKLPENDLISTIIEPPE